MKLELGVEIDGQIGRDPAISVVSFGEHDLSGARFVTGDDCSWLLGFRVGIGIHVTGGHVHHEKLGEPNSKKVLVSLNLGGLNSHSSLNAARQSNALPGMHWQR
ncbi:uncharacterized protein Nmag_3491 [Natrialba magadii ATCC 43099]|uniref:Uncharacterized protein n=1 Tax=Natrialba magadii (strain ATCC 43099 / DSM 3394 / CCM 3739 / CIP 104546 / IAM 13178 / JCM 8861 / NBRC 102185 / NCIMB 2190 / MS3) TaxID=547559 RepID=D3STH4_NATMM|nr:uncharacterized protein Nmag_3491 [Natrialba magadii ATCC 43099]